LAKLASANGFDGTTIFGEMPARSTLHEINYLSMARTADNFIRRTANEGGPDLEWDEFVSEHLGPLFGGAELAEKFVALLEAKKHSAEDLKEAKGILRRADEPAYQRWLWIVDYLYRHLESAGKIPSV